MTAGVHGNTALARRDDESQQSPIARILNLPASRSAIAPYLTHGVTMGQIVAEVWHAANKNPQILDCTEASIIDAVGLAVSTGLVIGKGVHLVPLNTKVSKKGEADRWELRLNAWLDYKGEIELVVAAGGARSITAKAIYEKEVLEYEEGSNPRIRHIPIIGPSARGKMIGAYAVAHHGPNVPPTILVRSIEEIEEIRKKSKGWSPKAGVTECPDWYAIKTAIHRLVKVLPQNPRLAKVTALFDRMEAEDDAERLTTDPDLDPSRRIAAPGAVETRAGETGNEPVAPSLAPAAAASSSEPSAPTISARDVTSAKATKLCGKPGSWELKGKAYAGVPMGDCPTSVLKQASHFLQKLFAEKKADWIEDQLEAIGIVLEDREANSDQTSIAFPTKVDDAPVKAENTRVRGEGKVADALDPKNEKKSLIERISRLCQNSEIPADKREQFYTRLNTAETIPHLKDLLRAVEEAIGL